MSNPATSTKKGATSMVKKIKIALLRTNLFVRHALNQDHALVLAELIESGVKLPPIKITRSNEVVDGRHRIEACELNNLDEIEFEFVDVEDQAGLIAAAYKANVGGSLPPTTQDTEHTISLLVESGETIKHIAELLKVPYGLARKYVQSVKSRMTRAKMKRAIVGVTDDNLTVAKAALRYDVDPDKLRETLVGTKRRSRQDLPDIQRRLTRNHKSLSMKNAALMRSLIEKVDDGDMTMQQVKEVITHIKSLQRKAARATAEWENRFSAKA